MPHQALKKERNYKSLRSQSRFKEDVVRSWKNSQSTLPLCLAHVKSNLKQASGVGTQRSWVLYFTLASGLGPHSGLGE